MQVSALNHERRLAIFKVQRSCFYDGPGIRTTLFFQGCGLRCKWCQNPEMQPLDGPDALENALEEGQAHSIDDVMDVVTRDKEYFAATGGGVTLSGGEPLLQNPEDLLPLLERLQEAGIHVAVETSLHVPWKHMSPVVPLVDLFLVDLKIVGDDVRHAEYTGQPSTRIHENVQKLLDAGANVTFRMVMVPGYNDDEPAITAAANFLRSVGHETVELLKYHHLYEDKARRLGVACPELGISPPRASAAIARGRELFATHGITPEYKDQASTGARKATFTPRVRRIQHDIRNAGRGICTELCALKTQYYKKHGFDKPTPLHRAECLAHVLHNKTIKVWPRELLVGNFTSKRVAGQLWAEYYGVVGIKMMHKVTRLKPVPFQVTVDEGLPFIKSVPFWLRYSVFGRLYPKISDIILLFTRASEMNAGFNNNLAAIAHFIVNFDRVLELGTTGLIAEARAKQAAHPENNPHFYEGVVIALQALEAFGARYAAELDASSARETDPARRAELEKMAAICHRVPKHPARTFHEALQCMVLLHVALCNEGYENAISFGRLDQVLYPYYKADREAGRITYEEAKELVCLFVLKMDEDILANDGDTFPELYNLFETLSTDQAITFGGVDKDGNDATNDVTYMLLDACELQPLAADLGARVHVGSPDAYLERIAEIFLNGCPIPQLFSDDVYIKALLEHYPTTTLEDARNYAIVGCVEPNATDDHFGNTDCANVNLCLPLLQALKGHEHDLWNYDHDLGYHLNILGTNFVKWVVRNKQGRLARFLRRACDTVRRRAEIKRGRYKFDPPTSMAELLARFQTRLNVLTQTILADHQQIEACLRAHFHTPLASALFKGCLERGKDVYEGGTKINSSGIQPVGLTDVADSLHALDVVVFQERQYSVQQVIRALEYNFEGEENQAIRAALLAVPKFGDDSSSEATAWENRVMAMYNAALESVDNCPRDGRYSAGYYALNVCTRYGKNTPALPSGRLSGVPLANGLFPHYGMERDDLLSPLNAVADLNFVQHAENGATATFTIDASLFHGPDGKKKLAAIIKTFLTRGGMQMQPNVVNREILLDAYEHPEKYPDLMVRIAGYCAYFNELSDEMKRVIINRTCYTTSMA